MEYEVARDDGQTIKVHTGNLVGLMRDSEGTTRTTGDYIEVTFWDTQTLHGWTGTGPAWDVRIALFVNVSNKDARSLVRRLSAETPKGFVPQKQLLLRSVKRILKDKGYYGRRRLLSPSVAV